MDTLILTGWGWKEYAVAAAIALKALGGKADVMGMTKAAAALKITRTTLRKWL